MNCDRDSTKMSPNEFVPCSRGEAIGLACRVAMIVHVVASVVLVATAWIMLGHEGFILESRTLIPGLVSIQLATLLAIMLPSACLVGIFAQFYFQQSGFAVERAIWVIVLTCEVNLVGWIVFPWFVGFE